MSRVTFQSALSVLLLMVGCATEGPALTPCPEGSWLEQPYTCECEGDPEGAYSGVTHCLADGFLSDCDCSGTAVIGTGGQQTADQQPAGGSNLNAAAGAGDGTASSALPVLADPSGQAGGGAVDMTAADASTGLEMADAGAMDTTTSADAGSSDASNTPDPGSSTGSDGDGNQLSPCATAVDCNKGYDCYVQGGFCSLACASDADCSSLSGGYTCYLEAGAGVCRVECSTEGGSEGCPAGTTCKNVAAAGSPASLRCAL
ncbi:MAG: hypothetical protein OEZ06_27920 [Myxococcales bacterium]|nr:hypothetical protein [Myxococcales bacterium]